MDCCFFSLHHHTIGLIHLLRIALLDTVIHSRSIDHFIVGLEHLISLDACESVVGIYWKPYLVSLKNA